MPRSPEKPALSRLAKGVFKDIKGSMTLFLQLILGGARSGKSRHALNQVDEDSFASRFFIATALPGDDEMKQRIERHRRERAARREMLEEPYRPVEVLRKNAVHEKCLIVVDCLTLWISNLLCGMGGKPFPCLKPGISWRILPIFFHA